MKGFRQKLLSYYLKKNERPSTLEFLPMTYPFWTRHAALTGMTSMDFDPTIGAVAGTDAVKIKLTEGGVTFDRTPLILAWYRFADDSGGYSDKTKIYKFPSSRRDSSGTLLESFDNGWFANLDEVWFRRKAISTYGSGTKRIWIKFFIFKDDAFINIDTSNSSDIPV